MQLKSCFSLTLFLLCGLFSSALALHIDDDLKEKIKTGINKNSFTPLTSRESFISQEVMGTMEKTMDRLNKATTTDVVNIAVLMFATIFCAGSTDYNYNGKKFNLKMPRGSKEIKTEADYAVFRLQSEGAKLDYGRWAGILLANQMMKSQGTTATDFGKILDEKHDDLFLIWCKESREVNIYKAKAQHQWMITNKEGTLMSHFVSKMNPEVAFAAAMSGNKEKVHVSFIAPGASEVLAELGLPLGQAKPNEKHSKRLMFLASFIKMYDTLNTVKTKSVLDEDFGELVLLRTLLCLKSTREKSPWKIPGYTPVIEDIAKKASEKFEFTRGRFQILNKWVVYLMLRIFQYSDEEDLKKVEGWSVFRGSEKQTTKVIRNPVEPKTPR